MNDLKSPRVKAVISGPKAARKAMPATRRAVATRVPDDAHWTFLTNHTHVLVLLSRNPRLVLREVALQVGITERAVQRIIAELETAGVIEREKIGRQNHYRIRGKQPLRHAATCHCTIGELLALINGKA